MAIRKHLSALVICLLAVFVLGGLLPATALAAAPNGQVIYVGDVNVVSGGYWTTDDSGNVTAFAGESTPTVTVSNNAIVRANGNAGGIGNTSSTDIQFGTGSDGAGGIVFDGKDGTVYGSVELQENLTIGEGESLTLDHEASLDANGHNVIVDGGTLDEGIKNNLGDSVKYTPTITTTGLPNGTAEAAYSTTLLADGTAPITWSVTSGSLTEGLSLDESTGEIIGTPTAEGSSTFTVKAENSYGSDSKELNITINEPASVSVIGVSLDQNTLTLTEDDTTQLTATVEPTNATNKDVTWSSDNEAVAMVDANGNVTAVSAGAATITVTTEDGSFTDTCKVSVKHGNMILTPQKDATCTAQGKLAYYTCETCGKIFSDAEGKTEISLADTVIPTTSHNYKDGKCTVCGAVDPNYQEPTSPTKDEPAAEDSTKNTKDKSVTKSSTPQTSDALFGYGTFFVLLIVLASIVSVAAYRKLHTVQAKHSSSNKH